MDRELRCYTSDVGSSSPPGPKTRFYKGWPADRIPADRG